MSRTVHDNGGGFLGKGKTSFHEEKPNVGFEILPFPNPQPLSRKAVYFFSRGITLPEIICPCRVQSLMLLSAVKQPAEKTAQTVLFCFLPVITLLLLKPFFKRQTEKFTQKKRHLQPEMPFAFSAD